MRWHTSFPITWEVFPLDKFPSSFPIFPKVAKHTKQADTGIRGINSSGVCGSSNLILYQRLHINVYGVGHNGAENTSAVFQALAVPVLDV